MCCSMNYSLYDFPCFLPYKCGSEPYLEGAIAGAKSGSQSPQSFYDCAQHPALHVVLKSFTLEHSRMNFFLIPTTWSIFLFLLLPLFWRTRKRKDLLYRTDCLPFSQPPTLLSSTSAEGCAAAGWPDFTWCETNLNAQVSPEGAQGGRTRGDEHSKPRICYHQSLTAALT